MNFDYGIHLCRLVIVFLFAYSALAKSTDLNSFEQAIENFRILPHILTKPFAYGVVFVELTIVALLLFDQKFWFIGFLISVVMLLIFAVSIVLVLSRKIKTPCNCFGASTQDLKKYDVVRNLGFILISLIGLTYSLPYPMAVNYFDYFHVALTGLLAVFIMLLLTNLSCLLTAIETSGR